MCTNPISGSLQILIDQPSVGGIVGVDAVVCSGTNGATLTLTGNTGTIIHWESSTDNGSTWATIANTTATQSYLNLTNTTWFRVLVQNGVCPIAYSDTAVIDVLANTSILTQPQNQTVCVGSNAIISLTAGGAGLNYQWQFNDLINGMTNIPGETGSTLNLSSVTTGMNGWQYQCIVTGTCGVVTSNLVTLSVDVFTIAGHVSPNATVCSGSNSGTITLTGNNGSVVQWESSTDNGLTWSTISNTTSSQNYLNLMDTTLYRALVDNGACPSAYSDTVTITVNESVSINTQPVSIAVCEGSNAGFAIVASGTQLTYQWQEDNGSGMSNILNENGPSLSLVGVTMASNGYQYRCIITGICGTLISDVVTLNVDLTTVSGNVTSNTTVCSGVNSGTLILSGNNGTIVRWESSTNNGATWSNISNTTSTQGYLNLNNTSMYRVLVDNGACVSVYSDTATITVNQSISISNQPSNTILCEGSTANFTIVASGSLLAYQWQQNTGSGMTNILNETGPTLSISNVTPSISGTTFQCVLSGACPSINSNTVTLTVSPTSVGGSVSPDTTVCTGTNTGTLTLSGNTGSVLRWEFSTNGGTNWTVVSNTTNTLTFNNISSTRLYRAIVKSGVCPEVNSNIATVTVLLNTAITSQPTSSTLCAGSTATFNLTATGTNLIYQWQDNSSGGFANIPGATNSSLILPGVTFGMNGRQYRCIVSGPCPQVVSNIVTLTVNPTSVAGTVGPNVTVCSGTNSGTLTVTGFTGSIVKWQISSNSGSTYSDIANTTSTLNFSNLPGTRLYRVIVKSGICPNDTSAPAIITFGTATSIITQPVCATVCENGLTGFQTVGNGTNIFYQWYCKICVAKVP